ncbi:MAG TPA: hypothetical protein VG756_23020 [Pseudonocardiaceae bacterium]|nr:hypothetical protein [Pseudonocardiaceae bacterium]
MTFVEPPAPEPPPIPLYDHPGLTFLGWYPNAALSDPDGPGLDAEYTRLAVVLSQLAEHGSDEQVERAGQVLARTRLDLTALLAQADRER